MESLQKSTCKQNFAHKNHITVVANSFITPTSRQRVGPYSPFLAFAGVRATPPGRVDTLVTTEIPKAPCAHLMLHSWAKKCDSIQSSQITTVYGVCIFHHIYIYTKLFTIQSTTTLQDYRLQPRKWVSTIIFLTYPSRTSSSPNAFIPNESSPLVPFEVPSHQHHILSHPIPSHETSKGVPFEVPPASLRLHQVVSLSTFHWSIRSWLPRGTLEWRPKKTWR